MVIDDQINNAAGDERIVNLFTGGSDHRNLSVIYIVQDLFHQGKGSRSISRNPGGRLPYESDGDARRKIRINTVKETNLDVALALFNP